MATVNPFATPAELAADRKEAVEREKLRKKTVAEVLRQISRYAAEAKVRGWSGPEQVYRLTIVRLREDLLDEEQT